ncbi:hypothetical protein [Caulobacter sp. BK020]|uniref:hypothetical protein n=1 Tax=Caulobacter sp. BK020 TaxID=2512117 RepID=UPI0010E4EB2F|nr:hypothetical protein [Caulobacter sp. BK020]TCS12719.1 hypothetical protein EV278_112144 [Caulobacter sp. BK020]
MRPQGLWLMLAASAAVLGACSTTTPPTGPATAPAGMKWNAFATPDAEQRLAYGLPDSDAVGIIFSCRRKATSVGFLTNLVEGKPGSGSVRLRSGKVQGRYAARLTRSEIADGLDATGQIPLADPVLAAFEQTGLISQIEDRAYPQDARTSAERADIRRFFGFCRG